MLNCLIVCRPPWKLVKDSLCLYEMNRPYQRSRQLLVGCEHKSCMSLLNKADSCRVTNNKGETVFTTWTSIISIKHNYYKSNSNKVKLLTNGMPRAFESLAKNTVKIYWQSQTKNWQKVLAALKINNQSAQYC
jgi:hypothetical protein